MQKNLSTILVSSLALVACSGGGSSGSPPTPAIESPPPPPPPVAEVETALETLSLKKETNPGLEVAREVIDEDAKTAVLEGIEIVSPDGNIIFTLDELALSGLQVTGEVVTLESMSLIGMSLAPPTNGYAYSVAEIELTDVNPAFAAYLTAAFLLGSLEDFDFSQAAFGRINITDASLVPIGTAADAPTKLSMEMDSFSLSTAVDGVVEIFSITGFEVDSDLQIAEDTGNGALIIPGDISLGSAEVNNYQLAFLNQQLLKNFSSNDVVVDTVTTLFGSPIEMGYDGFAITDASISAAGLGLATPEYSTSITRDGNGIATGTDSPRAEFSATIDTNEPLGELLDTFILGPLSLTTPTFYTQTTTSFDPNSDITNFNTLEVGIVDSFGFELSGEFEGLAAQTELLANNEGFGVELFDELKIGKSSVAVIDDGLSDALLGLLGGDGSLIRFAISTFVGVALDTNSLLSFSPATLSSTRADLDEWLRSGGKLTVSIDPLNRISLLDLSMFDISAEEIGWETMVEALE